jgi:fermentation-respiration switch protein FrsA (DUF1100 family)
VALLKTFLLIAGGIYLSIGVTMFLAQRSLMYAPDSVRTDPKAEGLSDVEERRLATGDGDEVIVWYGKAKPGQPTLLYFHGNAGALATRSERIRKYMTRGRGVYMMSYRGFSGSTGKPSEAANVADAKRAYDDLVSLGVATRDIFIYGESLGSGVAVQVAAEKPCAGLILDAPYTSIVDVAATQYPWLPVRPMLLDRYESDKYIANVRCPVLVVHGEQDEIIPVEMGRSLFAKAIEPKKIITFPNAGHADHWMFGSYDAINSWIDALRAGTAQK